MLAVVTVCFYGFGLLRLLLILWGVLYQVGFEMIDHISRAQGILMNTIQSKALIGIGSHSLFIAVSLLISLLNFCSVVYLDFLFDQYRCYWRGTCCVGKTSSLHELQRGVG